MNVAEDQMLDIDDVINETCPLTEYTLYATEISKSNIGTINSLKEIFNGEGTLPSQTASILDEIDPTLSKTNSQRFYSGQTAQTQITNVSETSEHLQNLKSSVDSINVDAISATIDSYNEHLSNLKRDSRKKLLETAADAFNAKKVEWKGFPKTKTYKTDGDTSYVGPIYDDEFNNCNETDTEIYEYDVVESSSTPEDIKDNNGMVMSTIYHNSITYKIHKYKRIKYWNYFKIINSPKDPTFEQIEQLFNKVGEPLPYDPSKINGDVGKANEWGINW